MNTQSEYALEESLIEQLKGLGYEKVSIRNESEMLANLKRQLEKHNRDELDKAGFDTLTDDEFERVLMHLNQGSIFDRAKLLRDRYALKRDDTTAYLRFLDTTHWCKNEYQVTHQMENTGKRDNRYDVTILINGLPLVQIELKKRGIELNEAFNQIKRYKRDSYDGGFGLFQYVQLFVVSNGVNTKYFANGDGKLQSEFMFYWSDKNNARTSDLSSFSEDFLKPCHVSKMITHYMVLTAKKEICVLRPYQFYAVEAIIERVKKTNENGYTWHTTGSGKTLTSFKASQIITQDFREVAKVLFVVDRKDLDDQTAKEFDNFSNGSVDGTDNTKDLVDKLKSPKEENRLIITTIQKLSRAISNKNFKEQIAHLQDQKIVIIFDECHRSQFGKTHKGIKSFFSKAQMFGFTGTPIFKDNAQRADGVLSTTKTLFTERLHRYTIKDAINDENVLKFSIEYVGRYREKEGANEVDIEVEGIDTEELFESDVRAGKIVDYILEHHDHKTRNREFASMFCVGSIPMLIKYYKLFQDKQKDSPRPLKIATIFSFAANEEERDTQDAQNGLLGEESLDVSGSVDVSSRDALEGFIADYNAIFNIKDPHSLKDSQSFYRYYKDISKRLKDWKEIPPDDRIDLLLVVNMFLTGFDSKPLNTLYVDKNLQLHGLLQAFSRTNRVHGKSKKHGNIVCFRNLKKATDDAITLFSDNDANETVLLKPYEHYLREYNKEAVKLLEIAPTPKFVDELISEDDQLKFVLAFRSVMRLRAILSTFADFDPALLAPSEQAFKDYESKYKDIKDKVKREHDPEKASILEDVDFELELIHRDKINVAYILRLLADIKVLPEEQKEQRRKQVDNLLNDHQLRSKRALIEEFIARNLPEVKPGQNIEEAFNNYWNGKCKSAFLALCDEEKLDPEKIKHFIDQYLYVQRLPRPQEIREALTYKPKLLESEEILSRVREKFASLIEIFFDGMGDF